MELPTVGAHCGFASCQSLSFLPFKCTFCQVEFCGVHRLPQDHACTSWSMDSQANSVQLCSTCEQMVLVPKGADSSAILIEHQASNCSTHLLPLVQSIAVPCARKGCRRRDRVVQTCSGCSETFCLGHRHQVDHDCVALERQRLEAEKERQRKEDMKAAIASKFSGLKSNSTTATGAGAGAGSGSGTSTKGDADAEKAKLMKAEAAKTAIAEARARVAARSGSGSGSTTSGATAISSTPVADSPATTPPKVKKASRVVTVMKLKKTAQGEDKIPLSSRIYVSIRSPIFPQLDDKSVYVDKTWTVGRALDKIVEWLKVTVPKNEPFDAHKRFSIFHAKELGNTPAVLNMQDRLQQASQVESGDVFYLAPADWAWSTESH